MYCLIAPELINQFYIWPYFTPIQTDINIIKILLLDIVRTVKKWTTWWINYHRKKFPVAWYWNLRFLFPSTYRSTAHALSREQSSFLKMYQILFSTRHNKWKAVAIGIVEVNPLGELTDCSTPCHSTRILTLFLTL